RQSTEQLTNCQFQHLAKVVRIANACYSHGGSRVGVHEEFREIEFDIGWEIVLCAEMSGAHSWPNYCWGLCSKLRSHSYSGMTSRQPILPKGFLWGMAGLGPWFSVVWKKTALC